MRQREWTRRGPEYQRPRVSYIGEIGRKWYPACRSSCAWLKALGKGRRPGDCTWNRRYGGVAGHAKFGPPLSPSRFKTPAPFCIRFAFSMNGSRRESPRKSPRSGVTRIAGGGAQRNPRSPTETEKSRVAAPPRRCSSDGDAATRHGPHALDSGGCAALHPRLITSCRSAAAGSGARCDNGNGPGGALNTRGRESLILTRSVGNGILLVGVRALAEGSWQGQTARRLHPESTLRGRGRSRKVRSTPLAKQI